MRCRECAIRKICKVYDIIITTGINLSINECEHYSNSFSAVTEDKATTQQSVKQQRQSRALNDVTELSNRMRAKEQAEKNGVEFIEKKEEDMIECSNCYDKVLMTFSCSKCDKTICPSCATVDLSNPGTMLCGECDLSDDISKELEQDEE